MIRFKTRGEILMVERALTSALTRRTVVKSSLVASAAGLLPLGLRAARAQDAIVATMVTDTAGLGDQNFNDLANKGGVRAAEELGVTWSVIESADQAAYIPNLTAAAENGDVVIGVGFLLLDAITEVANQFPDKAFVLIDAASDAPNVQGVSFKEDQLGFLAGVISGKVTKTNKIGVIDGIRIPPVLRYEVGFVAGVKSVNPDATVEIQITDTFSDPTLGKVTGAAQFNNGADIIFPIAGATGTGAYAAAAELNKPGEVWVVGVDAPQDHLAPGYELCVVHKGVDFAVFEGIKQVVDGAFKPGAITYDLASGGISFSVYADRPSAEWEGLTLAYQKMLIDGALVAPVDDETLAAFVAPAEPEPLEVPAMATPAS
jgi:basic membrane protein A and related proteins